MELLLYQGEFALYLDYPGSCYLADIFYVSRLDPYIN